MDNSSKYLCFEIENNNFALPLNIVDNVILSQTITKVENDLPFLKGIINLHGEIVPIISLRRKFNLTDIDIELSHRLIIITMGNRKVGILAEHVEDVIDIDPEELKDSSSVFNGIKHIKVLSRNEKLLLIYDLESLIDSKEAIELEKLWQSQKP